MRGRLDIVFGEIKQIQDKIVRFLASGKTILLVSEEAKFIRIFAGDHSQRGR